jgi:hypothetical protein
MAETSTEAVRSPRRIYRSVATLWAAILSAMGGVAGLVLGTSVSRGQFVLFAGGALLLLVGCRMSLVGIRAGTDSVTVATLFSSRKVPWSNVDHFAVMPLGRYPYVGYVVLRDGRKFGTFGLSTNAGESETKRLHVQRPVDELNQMLASRQERPTPTEAGRTRSL